MANKDEEKSPFQYSPDDDEAIDRPEWDDEDYAHKADEDEEFERPEWDQENWFKRLRSPLVGGLAGFAIIAWLLISVPSVPSNILSVAGARGEVSFRVIDDATQQPLYNVPVTIENVTSKTDRNGIAIFEGLKLGEKEVFIQLSAYETKTISYKIGWGANEPLNVGLAPTGQQYNFIIRDWLSKEPLDDVRITHDDVAAISGEEGRAAIRVVPDDGDVTFFTFEKDGYKPATYLANNQATDAHEVQMVTANEHVFVDEQSDEQGVYSIHGDGSERELLLAIGSAQSGDMQFSISPDGTQAALVAQIEGEAQQSLYVINLANGLSSEVDTAASLQLVGWSGDHIVFVKRAADAADTDPERDQLSTYAPFNDVPSVLVSSNSFNDVLVTDEFVFYAPSELYKEDAAPTLTRVQPNGSDEQVLVDGDVWSIVRSDYASISFNGENDWYTADLSGENVTSAEEAAPISKLYRVNPYDNTLIVLADAAASLLLQINADGSEETVLYEQDGLRDPVHWLSQDHLVFRVKTNDQVADYIYSIAGNKAVKLVDVSDVRGEDSWYYYYE